MRDHQSPIARRTVNSLSAHLTFYSRQFVHTLPIKSDLSRLLLNMLLCSSSVQVGSGEDASIVSVAYHPLLQLVISLTKDGKVQVWRIRGANNPNKPLMKSNFFEPSGELLGDRT